MALDPDRETADEDRARRALLLHDQGCSYAEIARRLEISKGKAHHLVGVATERREDAACEIPRPPGERREPTLQRAVDLVPRLARDFECISELIAQHVDLESPESGAMASHLDRIDQSFAWGYAALKAYVGARHPDDIPSSSSDQPVVEACRDVERSFKELVTVAVEFDETLRVETGGEYLLSVFGRDLCELAEILGLAFEPSAEISVTRPRWGELESASGSTETPLDAVARGQRNFQIATARTAGASHKELADSFGLSERQVRRVLADRRSGRYVSAAASVEVATATLASLRADLDLLDLELAGTDDRKERLRILQERVRRLEHMGAVMRDCGIASPDGFAAGQLIEQARQEVRIEVVRAANMGVRDELEGRGADPALIEAVLDRIVLAGGLEEAVK